MADSATAQWDAQLAQVASLSDDELATLENDLVTAFDAADQSNDTAGAQAIADALDNVRAEQDKRGTPETPAPAVPAAPAPVVPVAAAATATLEAPAVPAPVPEAVPPPEAAEPAEPAEVAEVPAVEATADPNTQEEAEVTDVAATETVTVTEDVQVPSGREPVIVTAPDAVVVAGADLPGISVGATFSDANQFGQAITLPASDGTLVLGGDGEPLFVATNSSPAPADRLLSYNDPEGNRSKIEAVTHLDAIVAAGGFCSPLTTRYDLFDIGGVADRPVRDALAGFQADRGGIRFFPAPVLSAIGGAVGLWTSANDAAILDTTPGPTKVCARIACPAEVTAEIQAVTLCLTFGVLQSRVFPELAVANNKLAMVAHARLAESALLAQIKAGSQAATETAKLSAVRDILDSIGRAVIYFRDRHRLGLSVPLRAIYPSWLLEVLRGDIAMGDPEDNLRGTLSMTDAEIEGFFADRKINVTWALDSAVPGTLGGGFFANAAGNIPAWPTTMEWALFPEGSWLFLDGGSLDLGVVRDSTLIKVNDYMQFSETFEAATKIGGQSFWITSTIKLTGQHIAPKTDPAYQTAFQALVDATTANA